MASNLAYAFDELIEDDAVEDDPAVNPFEQWVRAYENDPIAFAKDMLGLELYQYQRGPLLAVSMGKRKIHVTSGHGTGKTTVAAVGMLWFLLTRHPCAIVVTAPTLSQLDGALMGTLRSMIKKLPDALQDLLEVQSNKVFLRAAPDDAWIAARTARAEAPEALAGVHSDFVMLVVDEASGVPEQVFEHAVGSMSGHNATTMLLSNPTRRKGLFAQILLDPVVGEDWVKYKFSCLDSPLVSDKFVRQVIDTYGENSNQYRVRVLGELPTDDIDQLIPAQLVEDAIKRNVSPSDNAPAILGVDVARMGADSTAIVMRRDNVVTEVKAWSRADLMETTGRIMAFLIALEPHRRPSMICVDVIGVGGGVSDRLKELVRERDWPIRVVGVNVAENASTLGTAVRLRDELWLKAKEWLETKKVSLPDEPDLRDELLSPGYTYDSSGRIKIESKDEMRRRGVKSPDVADAFCMTFAGVAARLGKDAYRGALKRNLQGVL